MRPIVEEAPMARDARRGKARWQTARADLSGRLLREARRMRHTQTPAEALLWEHLRRYQLGVHFRRQHAIGRFIVDFCCLGAQLVIEVDGASHEGQAARDTERAAHLADQGFRVLRFSNRAVLSDVESVIRIVRNALTESVRLQGDPP
jgi:very-short-patch-repair endonuclease